VSRANVDKVRAFIDAYNRRDFEAALADIDPEIDWVLPTRQSSDSGRGHADVIRFWEGIDDTMDDLQLQVQEHVDAGDAVATRLRHSGRGKESGLEIDTELYHQVATFDDGGTIVRMEYFDDWDEALAAARASSQ
jgi:ketosteroid isomerase-like protein